MRRQEVYEIDQNQGLMGELFFRKALGQFKPGTMTQMSETFDRNLRYNTLAYISEGVQQIFDPENLIPQSIWKEGGHNNYRNGIKWHEGLSETDSRILANRFDRDLEFEQLMGNTDPWSIHNIGAALGSAAFDPLSYVPFVSPFAKAGQALQRGVRAVGLSDIGATITMEGVMGRGTFAMQRLNTVNGLSKTINPISATLSTVTNPFRPIGRYATEGMLAESSYLIIKNMADARHSEDVDYMGGVFDIMIAGLFGGVLGTLPMANIFRKNFKREQLDQALAKSLDDIYHKGEVNLHGKSPDGEPLLSSDEARIQHDAEMETLTKTQKYIDDDDLSPIKAHARKLNADLKEFLNTAFNAFRRCSS